MTRIASVSKENLTWTKSIQTGKVRREISRSNHNHFEKYYKTKITNSHNNNNNSPEQRIKKLAAPKNLCNNVINNNKKSYLSRKKQRIGHRLKNNIRNAFHSRKISRLKCMIRKRKHNNLLRQGNSPKKQFERVLCLPTMNSILKMMKSNLITRMIPCAHSLKCITKRHPFKKATTLFRQIRKNSRQLWSMKESNILKRRMNR